MPANLRRGIELTELTLAVRLAAQQYPNVAFFNVAFRDSPQRTFVLPSAQQSTHQRDAQKLWPISWAEYHLDRK